VVLQRIGNGCAAHLVGKRGIRLARATSGLKSAWPAEPRIRAGEVRTPKSQATYRLERKMTVSQAISAGGGLTPRGTDRRATVKRRSEQGKETRVTVKGSDLLQADDVLVIKESLF
jgi:hypothetical protein